MTHEQAFKWLQSGKVESVKFRIEEGWYFLSVIQNELAIDDFKVLINDTPGQMEFIKIKK